MNWHKRIEIWLLLALVIAGLFFVFSKRSADDAATETPLSSDHPVKEEALNIHRCVIERDGDHARLDIDVRVRNDSAQKLVLQSPQARLLNAKGTEINSFFLPFETQPEVPPNSSQDAQLRYWIDAADLLGTMTLDVNGKSVPVKSTKPFDLKAMANAEKKTVTGNDW